MKGFFGEKKDETRRTRLLILLTLCVNCNCKRCCGNFLEEKKKTDSGLSQLVIFQVVELIHSCLNPKFDMNVVFMSNYFFSGGDVPVDSETLLVTDFVNLKIKPTQSFEVAHKDMMCS
jgi:hypothetical protein